MTSGVGRLLIGPNASGTERLPGIMGGGSGATIRVSVSNSTSGGFKGPFEGTLSFVNQNGEWEDRDFYSSGNAASVRVITGGDAAFEPSFTIHNPNIMALRLHFKWEIWGSSTNIKEENTNEEGDDSKGGSGNNKTDIEEISEAAKEMSAATAETSDDFLFKKPEDLTEGEVKDLMVKRNDSQNNKPLFDELVEKERKWFSTRYGDDSIQFDKTGKMVQPIVKNPVPKEPKPLAVPGGQTMTDAIKVVAAQLNKSPDNKVDAIRGLQTGINRTKNKTEAPLKVDGVFGPKSAMDLKKSIASLGATKMTEANALGQFQHKTDKAKKSGDTTNLINDITTTFNALLPEKKDQKESGVGLALQTAINEMNKDDSQIPQLKEDGIIGSVTEDVFGMTVKKKDTENLTDNFGYFLGFT